MENTTFDYDYNYSDDPHPVKLCRRDGDNTLGAHLSTIFYFMFLFSVFGNVMVLVIIHRFEKMTTVTNILLLNLVVSSLIFMSSLPFMAAYMQLSEWIFGEVMCKIVGSTYYLGLYSSVLFLTLLTFDRHVAVVYSLGAMRLRNRSYAVTSCAIIWLVSALPCIKPMILFRTFTNFLDNKIYCEENADHFPNIDVDRLRTYGFYLQLLLFLIFPLVVIIYCYTRIAMTVLSSGLRAKFKTVRLIFIIVLLFFVCWTPFNVIQLLHYKTCEEAQRRGYALHISRNLVYIYFCFSPILYTFVGKKFQNYFRQMLVKRFPRLKDHISVSSYSKNCMATKCTPSNP
ncbi:C-C chemokine receptor type 3-like [Echeneis naucrates]|nr:C-C chemokine receptor type 3-like [Echeneis naucrates]